MHDLQLRIVLQVCGLQLQLVRQPRVVRIKQGDPLTACLFDADVAGLADTALTDTEPTQRQGWIGLMPHVLNCLGVVTGAVIDDQHFQRWITLPCHRAQGPG